MCDEHRVSLDCSCDDNLLHTDEYEHAWLPCTKPLMVLSFGSRSRSIVLLVDQDKKNTKPFLKSTIQTGPWIRI